MKIAVTGGTGFLGRYIVRHLATAGHELRCWHRPQSDRGGFDDVADRIIWVPGSLGDADTATDLVASCDAVIHAALDRPGEGFRGSEGDVPAFAERNVIGALRLIEAARNAGAGRFIFISSCAVHEKILDDRPLNESHPAWPTSHYGAHKAALEKFIHAYGWGDGYEICALRPCGIYGLARPVERSKWFDLVRRVTRGEAIDCQGGGKEVHAADVAAACETLLHAPPQAIAGEAFNCCDGYVSRHEVATLAKEFSGSAATLAGGPSVPKHTIATGKLEALGFTFQPGRLRQTVAELVTATR